MKIGPLLWFIGGYIGVVAVCIWLDISVLCRGDPKFDQGCGGFGLYFLAWVLFTAPIAMAAALVALLDVLTYRLRVAFLVTATMAIAGALQFALSIEGSGIGPMYVAGGATLLAAYLVAWGLSARERRQARSRPAA